MQYTALGFRWDDETVDNRKDDYQKRLEASRNMGIMDVNIDGKVAKSEVRGRMGQRLLAAFDQLDTDKDGYLTETEMASIASIMQRSINAAQAQQSVGQ
jgi:Ca2+-binding EF-hand superfamily protein